MRGILNELLARLRGLPVRDRLTDEAEEEFHFHLDLLTQRFEQTGMSRTEAARAARRQFGSLAFRREELYRLRGFQWLDELVQDARYAVRGLRRAPAFATAAIVTLVLALGANTAIYALLDAVMLRPLDIAAADELWILQNLGPDGPDPQRGIGPSARFSYPAFERYAAAAPAGTVLTAMSRPVVLDIRIGGGPGATARGQLVSASYFRTFGISAVEGRLIADADVRSAAERPIAVVSHRFRQNRLESARSAVGQTIAVNGIGATVVAATGFDGVWTDDQTEIWLPITVQHQIGYRQNFRAANGRSDQPWLTQDGISWLTLVARANPSQLPALKAALDQQFRQRSLERADAQGIAQRERAAFLAANRLLLTSFARGLSEVRVEWASPLFVLAGMVAMVLILASVNVGNLLLARGVARRQEIGIRLSLGASRMRVIRQLLVESLILSAIGMVLGVLIGHRVADQFAQSWLGHDLPFDSRVVAFSTVVASVTALLFGAMPAFSATDLDLKRMSGSPTLSAFMPFSRMRLFLSIQVALAYVLIMVAFLCGRSLANLSSLEPGFERDQLVSLWFNPTASGYRASDLPAFYQRITESVSANPGVVSVAMSDCGLADGCRNSNSVEVVGHVPAVNEKQELQLAGIDANFLDSVGIPLLDGRGITAADMGSRKVVAVINQTAARRYFSSGSAVGRHFHVGRFDVEIVGVARDARINDLAEPSTPTAFVPLQPGSGGRVLTARVEGSPEIALQTIRRALIRTEPGLVIERSSTIGQRLDRNVRRQSLTAYLAAGFALLALTMAAVGIYGVMTYVVSKRTAEFGIRVALGAHPGNLVLGVMRDGAAVALAGLLVGACLSIAGERQVAPLLFGVRTGDPLLYGAVAASLGLVLGGACYRAARRAAALDPRAALQCE